jgi:hypothetical protein
VEVFAPMPAELVRRYGAKKLQDEKYEVSPLNLPWVFKQEVDMVLKPGGRYVIEGVQVEGLTPPLGGVRRACGPKRRLRGWLRSG